MRDTPARFNALVNRLKPKLRKAFWNAVNDIAQTSDFTALVRALERGDVDEALRALRIDDALYRPLENALVEIYRDGGGYAVDGLPKINPATGQQLIIRFGIQSPRAQRWLADESSRLIADITESQRQAARETMVGGLSEGRSPRSTALDLVGRYNPATRQRTGGTVGLGSRETRAVENYRARLREEGRAEDQVERMTRRYSSKLLRLRGERIARTETIAALNAGRMEAMRQAIDDGEIKADAVTKVWKATKDGRTRDAHAILDGREAGFDEPFQSITGALLGYPGDTSLGASGRDVIQCRCTFQMRVDYGANLRR